MEHTVAGYMVGAATTFKYVFDHHEGDVYWCTADCGWITGHSYVTYGTLLHRIDCVHAMLFAGRFQVQLPNASILAFVRATEAMHERVSSSIAGICLLACQARCVK